jgi:hypothetical protein
VNPPDLVIIGAARSGTNALRDALCSTTSFHTWPCDEINYIWRHGNRTAPTDELTARDARPEVVQAIRALLDRRRRRAPGKSLVEKTCANTLRVEFVDRVLPDALYIHLVRDGREVVASARERWRARLDLPYLARKARFVPIGDLSYYATRYARGRWRRIRSTQGRLPTWGPRFPGIDELASSAISIEVLCAHQWVACVTTARAQLARIDPWRVLTIQYEALVSEPLETLRSVASFAGADPSPSDCSTMADTIRRGSVGTLRSRLGEDELRTIEPVIVPTLRQLGYA